MMESVSEATIFRSAKANNLPYKTYTWLRSAPHAATSVSPSLVSPPLATAVHCSFHTTGQAATLEGGLRWVLPLIVNVSKNGAK